LFAGRKLLVADDAPYYQTVISLTFTDEGMEVATAGDGHEALEKVEQFAPDVILASVSMPGIGGYELCQRIKQSERFGHIPVMLLVGLHEPFDQAEARRAGADDVVTKPFQSIRQLVGRVGSLLGGKAADAEDTAHEYSTLGLGRSDNAAPAAPDNHPMAEPNLTVFVEAPSMNETDATNSIEPAGSTCAADIELQTADTMKLQRIDDEPPAPVVEEIAYAQDDAIETEPAIKLEEKEDSSADIGLVEPVMGVTEMSEQPSQQTEPPPHSAVFDDAILDLGDFESSRQRAIAEDVILDLDYEEPTAASVVPDSEPAPELAAAFEATAHAEMIPVEPLPEPEPAAVAELQEWAIVNDAPALVEEVTPEGVVDEVQGAGVPGLALSAEAIDAIARRAVEHMSEKVVREIAWEVVPELAELLIKKKLEEQK